MNASPLQLTSHLTTSRFKVDAIPFIDLGIIALFFLFAGNSLFVSSGLPIQLSGTNGEYQTYATRPPDSVLTIYSPSVFFFEGRILNPAELEAAVREFTADHSEVLLLVRLNQTLFIEQINSIWKTLANSGVHSILIESENTGFQDGTP